MARSIQPVIIAGGSGTRLWPVSRPEKPKPFVDLLGDGRTLFQRTLDRSAALSPLPPLVICNRTHAPLVQEQAVDRQPSLLLEPEPRDTAAAICAAALWCERVDGGEQVLAIMPADHLVKDAEAFAASVRIAAEAAQGDAIATLAIAPTRAATEFGYLHLAADGAQGFHEVSAFIEKPDASKAAQLLQAGDNYWNAGIFVAKARTLLTAFADHLPEALAACSRALDVKPSPRMANLDAAAFAHAPKISFDYGVMEKHSNVLAVKARFDWHDLGTWAAIHAVLPKDEFGNVFSGDVAAVQSRSVFLRSRMVSLSAENCRGALAIEDNGYLLVMPLHRAASLRTLSVGDNSTLGAGGKARIPLPWCGGHLEARNGGLSDVTVTFHPDA